jgi:hypothetical protein
MNRGPTIASTNARGIRTSWRTTWPQCLNTLRSYPPGPGVTRVRRLLFARRSRRRDR